MYNEVLAKRVERIKTKKEGEREMGKILDEIKNEGIMEGEQRGLLIGREETKILSIQNLMASMNWSVEEAMKALMIPPNEQEHYMKII